MSSLAEVARHAGVSKATASRALSGAAHVSEATRARVAASAAELGFVASTSAASLVTGRSRNVGVVTPFISRWFFGEVIEGVEEALIDAGYDLTLFRVQEDPDLRQRVFDYFLVRKRVDAVITVCVALSPEEISALAALGKPVVGIGGGIAGMSSIRIDDVAASRLATEHLLSLGHSHILHVGGDQEERMDFHVHAQRLAGFRQAMATAGHRPGDDFAAAEFTIAGGFSTGLRVLGNPTTRPSAIVAASDEIAIGVILAARQLGIQVPRDLSVVGIDDHDLAEMFGLTTVRQVPRAQGRDAVSMIMASINSGELTRRDLQLPLALRVRSSTSAPQHG
ncbi:LacI family DNA-binding transcriptional regulator [uncultured Schumannella sp.]|uniref:LacI family DNA-binding transcriptional regulator n=1 Tax=uncultured Schumannella sp. TaxID=1195956 RepID=UPI0025EBA5F5|nr:LacI family DNA-binding transcriptional regulator [uncultured Schumannella sp.]